MKKNIIKIFVGIFLILSIILVFFTVVNSNEHEPLQSKTEDELKHFEDKILDLANKLNNITFTNYILTQSEIKNSEESTNKDTSQSQGSSSGNEQSEGNSQSGGSSSGGNSGNEGQNSQSKESEVTQKYEMEQSSILTNEQKDIDWDYIKYNSELLDSNWSTIVIDLHSLNVDNNDILTCGDTLNNLIISVKNEDKVKTLQTLSDLYSYIPKYTKQYSEDTSKINLEYTKYFIIDAYTLAEEDKWDEMKMQIQSAKNYFLNIVNAVDENKNQNKINKIYVLINELDNSINYKDKELFYMKYKTLMENIEKL